SLNHAQALTRLYQSWDTIELSQEALRIAQLGIVDVVACILGGAGSEAAQKVRHMIEQDASTGPATIIGTSTRVSPACAALANGVAGHVLDYDDMSFVLMMHPSVVLAPALFALGEARRSSGADIVRAYVLGHEVNAHFARTMIPHHYDLGWHSTSSVGLFGATAACCRLLGMDAAQALNAMAMAASHAGGLHGNFGFMTKSLHAGSAAETAVRSATLSAVGMTANPGLFDVTPGYFGVYGHNPLPKPVPPGGALEIEYSGIGIKPYPCAGPAMTLIDAALQLRSAQGLSGTGIESVNVTVAPLAVKIMGFHEVADSLQAKYSLAYCAAVALIDGRAGLAQFDDARVLQDDVRELVRRTQVRSDPGKSCANAKFEVEITVKLTDGRAFSHTLDTPLGHPSVPMQASELESKFMECAVARLGASRSASAFAALLKLPDLPTISGLL
ncbi:MAG: MmgE/PrpD family protein, partial [Desulfobacterales bacterium]|nr:MmgE/PrpD family protein [Desulfobacterales bacterium]